MLNTKFIERKCRLIAEELEKIRPLGAERFDDVVRDFFKYSTIERVLEKVITRAIDVNRHLIAELGDGTEKIRNYEDTFHALAKLGVYDEEFAKKIAPSAGLRNRLVHEYNDTKPEIIHASVKEALSHYVRYCESVLNFVESRKE